MGLQINTNVNALNAYRNLTGTQGSMTTSLERLSSGLRINRAADDAAGLAISEKLRAQVNGLNQAQANAQDGVSLIQTAEGALNEVHSILQRMRTLAVQSASDTNTDDDRSAIQKEVSALVDEVRGISTRTQFNGMNLLNGDFATGKSLQIGANNTQTMNVNIAQIDETTLNLNGGTAAATIGKSATPATVGAEATTVGSNVIAGTYTVNTAGTGLLDQHGNVVATVATNTATFANAAANNTVVFGQNLAAGDTFTVTGPAINLSTKVGAAGALLSLDQSIKTVSDTRAALGALQNRLDHTIKNLGVSAENLAASESRIRDTDMAKEMTNFTRSQILQQAGVSMLAQANQSSQSVLKLLG